MKTVPKTAYIFTLFVVLFFSHCVLKNDWTRSIVNQDYNLSQSRRVASEKSELNSIRLPLGYSAADIPYIKNWNDYLRAMGVIKNPDDDSGIEISRGSNMSIIKFNRERFKNACFGKLASYFYDEILRQDLRFYSKNDLEGKKMGSKASLADRAGQGIYSQIKPGWLWYMALKYSNGDKNLAFQLFGVCGHDDAVSDANVKMYGLSKEAEERRDKYIKFYSGKGKIARGSVGQVMRSYQYRECPNTTSLMYLSGSLGNDVDISSKLKDRISTIQAPNEGSTQLPSKYYHVIGGAFAACLALERCPDSLTCPIVFKSIHEAAINIYRGKDICEKVSDRGTSDKPQKDYQIIFQKRFPKSKDLCGKYYDVQSIENMLLNVRHTDCPRAWEKARCESALLKLKTYKVDFEWSRAQHEVAYSFAKNNCPTIGSTKDPIASSCEVLKIIEANTALEASRPAEFGSEETNTNVR